MTQSDDAQVKAAVDAILARAGLQVNAEDYERLRRWYPEIERQRADMRLPETRTLEPAMVYRAP